MTTAALALFTKIGTFVGAESAVAATVGSAVLSTAVTGISAISASRYNAAVLRRNQALEAENAERIRQAGQTAAQEADFEAAAVFGDIIANQGASGFSLDSGSFQARRQKNRLTASINRRRIIRDAEIEGRSADERARAFGASARFERQKGFFALISSGIGFSDDLISGANLASDLKRRQIGRDTSNFGFT